MLRIGCCFINVDIGSIEVRCCTKQPKPLLCNPAASLLLNLLSYEPITLSSHRLSIDKYTKAQVLERNVI